MTKEVSESEGLSAVEVGRGVAEHGSSGPKGGTHQRRDRMITIAEAILLSVVTLMAAWSGYAAAKWSTESRVTLAEAAGARTNASRATLEALDNAKALDERAERSFAAGAAAGETADKYVRTTVFLASVLFLVGICTHFPLRGVRYALVGLGAVLLVVSLVQLTHCRDRRREPKRAGDHRLPGPTAPTAPRG